MKLFQSTIRRACSSAAKLPKPPKQGLAQAKNETKLLAQTKSAAKSPTTETDIYSLGFWLKCGAVGGALGGSIGALVSLGDPQTTKDAAIRGATIGALPLAAVVLVLKALGSALDEAGRNAKVPPMFRP